MKQDNATTFEDIEDFKMTDLDGTSQQVLTDAWMMNTGAALTEADLFTAGSYPIHHEPGMFTIYAKKVNDNTMEMRTVVEDWAIEAAKKELVDEKALNELRPASDRCKHCVPMWIRTEIMFKHNINPDLEPEKYEQIIWQEYRDCWLDDARAPKYN